MRSAVRQVGGGEAAAVVPCLLDAFWDYPETVHLLPSPAARRRVLPRYLGSDAADAARFGSLFAVDADGAVAGAAAWVPPAGYPVGPVRQLRDVLHLLPAAPWAIRSLVEARRGQLANRAHHGDLPPHWWLRSVGVAPASRGTGAGSALVRAGTDLADRDGVGCFLFTATEANVGWYERLGFRVAASYRPTPTWPQNWAMWRDPVRVS